MPVRGVLLVLRYVPQQLDQIGPRAHQVEPLAQLNARGVEQLVDQPGHAGRCGVDPLQAEDIAGCIMFVLTRPFHVNIDEMVIKARNQSSGGRIIRE